jgi:cytochrome c-type biogenesis protein CcmH
MMWLWGGLWLLMLVSLFALLWQRTLRRADSSIALPHLWLFPAIVLVATTSYLTLGYHPETEAWLSEYADNRDLVQTMIDGKPDPALRDVPVPVLTRTLQRQLALQPSAEGWYTLALLYGEMEAPAVAITAARNAQRLAPNEQSPKLLLARSLIAQADGQLVPEAQTLIEEVIAQAPTHDGAWMMLATAAMTSADYDLALAAFDDLLSRHNEGEAGAALTKAKEDALERQKNQSWLANISIEVTAAEGIEAGGTLFVFLRKPGDTGQPMAAVRLLADGFPLQVKVAAANWLQQPPAPGTPLVAGARYAMAPGQGVDQAGVTAENQPLVAKQGRLSASLELR